MFDHKERTGELTSLDIALVIYKQSTVEKDYAGINFCKSMWRI